MVSLKIKKGKIVMWKDKFKKIWLVFAFAASFFGVVVIFLNNCFKKVRVSTAEIGEIQNFAEAQAFIVRDEEVLTGGDSFSRDCIKYLYSDGGRIAKNSVFAEVYSSPQAAKASSAIDNINAELSVLSNINNNQNNISKSVAGINSQINSEINDLFSSINNSELSRVQTVKNNLRYLLTERQVILGKNVNFNEKINDLKQKKSDLLNEDVCPVNVITSPEAGDLIVNIDGYENSFDYKNILNTDFNKVKINGGLSLDNTHENDEEISEKRNDVIGKIIKSEVWYALCSLDASMSAYATPGADIEISILSIGPKKYIPAKIESVFKDDANQKINLIISCDYMNKDLAYLRKENLKIVFNSYDGLIIDSSSLHESEKEDGSYKFGVYVKAGGYLKWKSVVPIFFQGNTVVCKYSSEEYADESYLQSGDNVVVGGRELYEGKNVK